MIRKNFIKNKENFVCLNCGHKIRGTGYTNHCSNCLYSRHVDLVVPGDRKNSCGGLMKPIGIEKKDKDYIILHLCLKCGARKKNKSSKNDNFAMLIKVSQESQK